MADLRCDKCGASWEWDLDAETCPNCGFSANPHQTAGDSKAVDNLFDRGGDSSSVSPLSGAVARLKTNQPSDAKGPEEDVSKQGKSAPEDPGYTPAETVAGEASEEQTPEEPQPAPPQSEEQGDAPEEAEEPGARSSVEQEGAKDEDAGELAPEPEGETEEAAEEAAEETTDPASVREPTPDPEDEPGEAKRPEATGEKAGDLQETSAAEESESATEDDFGNTVELEAIDMEIAADPPRPPPTPAPESSIKGMRRNTLELDQADLLEVAVDKAPPKMPPAIPEAQGEKHDMRGRVAYPIRADETPLPSTLPRDVDELAVAGQPPTPYKRSGPLKSQTEQLEAIRARKRRRTSTIWMGAVLLLGICSLTAWRIMSSRPAPMQGADPLANRVVAGPDSRVAARPAPPDAAGPDLARAEAAPPDQGSPDLPAVDTRRQRTAPRPALPKVRSPRIPAPRTPRPAPGIKPAATVELKGEAKDLYRQGIMLMMRGNSKGAVAAFKGALKKDTRFSLAYRGLGLAYQKMNQRAQARASFRRYLILNSKAPDAESIQKRIKSLE